MTTATSAEVCQANKTVVAKFLDALCAGDSETPKTMVTVDIEAFAMGTGKLCGLRRLPEILQVARTFPIITQSGLMHQIISMTAEAVRVAIDWEGNCTLKNSTP